MQKSFEHKGTSFYHIWVTFEYQGYWVKAKLIWEKIIIYLFQLVIPLYLATGH